jgi:hypothetical protein
MAIVILQHKIVHYFSKCIKSIVATVVSFLKIFPFASCPFFFIVDEVVVRVVHVTATTFQI